jgi:sugar lactone lactonase YvrE
MRRLSGVAAATGLVIALGACAPADETTSETPEMVEETSPGPELVRIQDPGLHPEGIEWDGAGGRFLVSSVTRGTVTEVRDDGSHSIFINDPDIVSSIGIHIDRANSRLLVANSNVAAFQGGDNHAMLGSYDLETGERAFMVDLGALTPSDQPQFANDVTSTPDGTAYVTNYVTAAIYTVTPAGEASVLVSGDALAPGGINGIEYHPDGYLIAAQVNARGMIKVGLDGSVSAVELPEPMGIDGIVMMNDGRLAVVAGTGEGDAAITEAIILASTDGWQTATIEGRWQAATDGTTAAVRGDEVYVVDARFADMGGEAPHFDITKAHFE